MLGRCFPPCCTIPAGKVRPRRRSAAFCCRWESRLKSSQKIPSSGSGKEGKESTLMRTVVCGR